MSVDGFVDPVKRFVCLREQWGEEEETLGKLKACGMRGEKQS